MRREKTILSSVLVATLVVLAITACGRNWCVGGLGPCDQFNNMETDKKPKPIVNGNTCGYQTTGNPRNGLTINYALLSPTRPNAEMNVNVTGGTPPYRAILGNNFFTLTPNASATAESVTSWSFRAGTQAGFACFKIVDSTMRDGDQCDNCSAQIQIASPSTTVGTTSLRR